MSVSILSCGIGNVRSVENACRQLGCETLIARDGDELKAQNPRRIILPGVGAVGEVLVAVAKRGYPEVVEEMVFRGGIPFLGICVGMQILGEVCEEDGEHRGWGWVPGRVRKLEPHGAAVRVPHIGWNSVRSSHSHGGLFDGLPNQHFYFVHSYAIECPSSYAIAFTEHGKSFPSAIRKGNAFGVQFHPEKSSNAGSQLLANFLYSQC